MEMNRSQKLWNANSQSELRYHVFRMKLNIMSLRRPLFFSLADPKLVHRFYLQFPSKCCTPNFIRFQPSNDTIFTWENCFHCFTAKSFEIYSRIISWSEWSILYVISLFEKKFSVEKKKTF